MHAKPAWMFVAKPNCLVIIFQVSHDEECQRFSTIHLRLKQIPNVQLYRQQRDGH